MKKEELVIKWMNHILSTCTLYKDKTNPKIYYYVLNGEVKFLRNDSLKIVDIEYQTIWVKSLNLFYSNAPDFYRYLQCWLNSNNWLNYSVFPSSDLDLCKKDMELV